METIDEYEELDIAIEQEYQSIEPSEKKVKRTSSDVWKFYTKIRLDKEERKRCGSNDVRDARKLKSLKIEQMVSRERCAKLILRRDFPFKFVEYEDLTDWLQYLNPEYTPTNAGVVKVFMREKAKLKEEMANIPIRISLTSDLWTSCNTEGYVNLTAHFVDKNLKLNSKILKFRHMPPPHSGFELSNKAIEFLQDWGIEKKVFSITLDNASANDVMQQTMKSRLTLQKWLLCDGEFVRVCCANIMNLTVQEGLKVATDALHKIRDNIKYPLLPSAVSYKRLSFSSSSMKFTCLSKGKGFHFPPCHMLNFCGIRILLDCPLDLSALVAFSPVPTALDAMLFEESNNTEDNACLYSKAGSEKRQKIEKLLDVKSLLFAEPWYKTVNYLHLWNASVIDVILISSPMGIMGLPFLTRRKGFSAKIYVTEASARLGQLMMEDLVSMHVEFRQFYGPEESNVPPWLRQEELEILPSVLKEILLGKDGVELGGWMSLYSAADVKDCILKINTLRYAEEACYNGTLVIKAFSSGVEIGSCNWILNGPKGNIAYLSTSCFFSAHAMTFDYRSLQGTSTLIYSDFSSLSDAQDIEDGDNYSDSTSDKLLPKSLQDLVGFNLNSDENSEENEKLVYICSCAIECVKDGGSVLIPINRLGTILQLLEEMTKSLEASAMKVPVYIISSVAEELLALLNIIPEWLCKQRQERLFAGEPLFAHVKLLKEQKIHVVPDIHSHQLLKNWQEPCIVFCPHWSLRLGPVVHLLRHWCGDSKSLLILEQDTVNPDLALLPFKPIAMKVLQCLFPSGIGLQKVQPLLKTLQPKTVLVIVQCPEELRLQMSVSCEKSFSVSYYAEAETLKVSCQKDSLELKIATDLASQAFKNEGINIARLKGKLLMENARHHLLLDRSLVRCGLPDSEKLLAALSNSGINASMELGMGDAESENVCTVHTEDPYKALIEIGTTGTIITTADANVASIIYKAVDNILDGV